MLKTKNLSKLVVLISLILLFCVALFLIPHHTEKALAAGSVGNTFRVCTNNGEEYIDYDGQVLDYKPSLYLLIALPDATDAQYAYYESEYAIENIAGVPNSEWNKITSGDITVGEKSYKYYQFTPLGDTGYKYYKYVYLKRVYNGMDEYSRAFPIQINTGVDILGFHEIKSTYKSGGNTVDYKGNWVNDKVTFKITTSFMNTNGTLFDSTSERLFYSTDMKNPYESKDWIPLSANILELNKGISSKLYFKLSNASQTDSVYKEFDYTVNIDKAEPKFSLTAVTQNTLGEETDYLSGSWTSGNVTFLIERNDNCLSAISYEVNVNGNGYSSIGGMQYVQSSTVEGIKFKARNEAGGEYESEEFVVKIDKVRPIAQLSVLTDDPDNEGATMAIKKYSETDSDGNIVEFDYAANGKIYLNIFNKDIYGNLVNNISGLKYYCQVKNEGDEDFGNAQLINRKAGSGENTYYQFEDSITSGISIKRTYRIYIVSDAGLQSDYKEFTAVLVNGNFNIEVQEISYSKNANGWANEPIPVYVTVPTNTKAILSSDGSILGYTVPTTKYTFYYSATDIADLKYSAKGEYVNGVEAGKSLYKFLLDASADSKFNVYAKNMAGKKSNNTYTSEEKIRIDTNLPDENIELQAMVLTEDSYIAGTHIAVQSGEWVYGRIILTLRVKIGISNIFVYELQYVKGEDGKPIRDNDGNIVWLNNSTALPQTSVEGDVAVYKKVISSRDRMTEYIAFRIFTGSGVYKDVEYVANIDNSNIFLTGISTKQNSSGADIWQNVNNNKITLKPAVSANFDIRLRANAEQNGHFDYLLKQKSGEYVNVSDLDDYIQAIIPENRKGTLVIVFKLKSKAVNYLGEYKISDDYEIKVDYNTLNITINYAVEITGDKAGDWNKGELNVRIGLQTKDEGGVNQELSFVDKQKYKYYYMRIRQEDFVNEFIALRDGSWEEVDLENGIYDAANQYNFIIKEFNNSSFYGYLAFSVCNEAGYRSSSAGFVANVVRIDNAEVDVKKAIKINAAKEDLPSSVDENDAWNYYTNSTFRLYPQNYNNRAPISYYYYELIDGEEDKIPTSLPIGNNLNGWKALSGEIIITPQSNAYEIRTFLLYAYNPFNKEDGGFSVTYKFYLDTCSLSGVLSHSPSDGGYMNSAIGLYSYMWQDNAKITLSVEEKSGSGEAIDAKVHLYFAVDGGEPIKYTDKPVMANSTNEIIINRDILETKIQKTGIMGVFTFMAKNLAGTEYIYPEKIYIAMDNEAPDFEINLTINGSKYSGGSVDFNDNTGKWSSSDINIELNLLKANVSGVKYTYYLKYYEDSTEKTTEEKDVPSRNSFSSYDLLYDSALFPYRSGDVVLAVRGTNKKNKIYYTERQVRMRIDRIIPTFDLKGNASSSGEASVGVEIISGEWTNHTQVVVSKSNMAKNTSKVTYKVTYEDLTSTQKEQFNWTQGNSLQAYDHTCTLTVEALSEAGLACTKVFQINIDTIAPQITFMGGINVVEGEKQYIDLKVVVREENIKICQYITVKEDKEGFPLNPSGYIISTSSVDNSTRYDTSAPEGQQEYRGYVRIYVEDYAGNNKSFEFYMLPFELTVNTITLSDADKRTMEEYEEKLDKARIYMESSRIVYFENLIERLKDRVNTLKQEIAGYRAYLEKLSQRTSYELKSDYEEIFSYMETYNNYKLYGQEWIQKEITGDASSKYNAYYKNLKQVYAELDKQMDAVREIENMAIKLPAINVVEAEDYNDVINVYNKYNGLSADQKACYTDTLYTKLLSLKKKCETLLLIDADTGIAIDGNLAPGARIEVTKYDASSEYYINAQSAILGAFDNTMARAIVSIDLIALEGKTSQTATGDITVTLPIPEEWQDYITFGVYKYSLDGSIIPIENMKIAGDGKSITFDTNGLATFVLCAKANISNTTVKTDVFGTFLGLELDVAMVRNLAIAGAALFIVMLLVIVITGIRRKKFLNTYNKAYKASIYRKSIQRIPKGNTMPRTNPLKPEERVKTPKHPY